MNTQTTTENTLHAEIVNDFLKFGLKLEIGENVRGVTAKCIKDAPKSRIGFKTLFYYRFSTDAQRIKYLGEYLDKEKKIVERKETEKQTKRDLNKNFAASDFYKVGDFVYNTWGYEQTNIEFYQVLEVKNKSLIVREVYQETEENSTYSHGMACNVLPKKDDFIKDNKEFMLRLKIREWDNKINCVICNPKSYYHFVKYDGRPKYKSWYY